MARLIPKKMKSKVQVCHCATWADLLICAIAFLTVVFVAISVLPFKFLIIPAVVAIAISLLIRVDCLPVYVYMLHFLRHFVIPHRFARDVSDEFLVDRKESLQKAFGELFNDEEALRRQELERLLSDPDVPDDVKEKIRLHRAYEDQRMANLPEPEDKMKCKPMELLCPFTEIADDLICYANAYYGSVMAISAPQMSDQVVCAEVLGKLLRDNPCANLVKLERPFRASVSGETVLLSRLDRLEAHFYLVLFGENKEELSERTDEAVTRLTDGGLQASRLSSKEIAVFLKYSNDLRFDEDQIDWIPAQDYALWAMPKIVKIKANTVEVNHVVTHNLCAVAYPQLVEDGWLSKLFNIPSTKCVLKCRQADREAAISALKAATLEQTDKSEYALKMNELLTSLENSEETLLEVSVHVSIYDRVATEERFNTENEALQDLPRIADFKEGLQKIFREQGIVLNRMPFDQFYAFLGAQISAMEPECMGAMPATTVAACAPWKFEQSVQSEMQDNSENENVILGELNIGALNERPTDEAEIDGETQPLCPSDTDEETAVSVPSKAEDGVTVFLAEPAQENEEQNAVTAGE